MPGKSARRRHVRYRKLWYVLCLTALVAGLGALSLAVLVQQTPETREPQPLPLGAVYTSQERVFLAGDLVVYGRPPTSERPSLAELGCQVTEGGGPLSTDAAAGQDRIVVDGRGLVPLATFSGRPGHSIACSGPAAAAAAPLYVAPGTTARGLVPLAGYSLAVFLLPVSIVGLLMLGASRT